MFDTSQPILLVSLPSSGRAPDGCKIRSVTAKKKEGGGNSFFFSRIWELVFIARRRLSSGGLPASSSLVACRLRACPFSRQGGKILYPSRCRTTYCSSRGHHFRPPPFPPRLVFYLPCSIRSSSPRPQTPPLALLFYPSHHGGGGKEPRFLPHLARRTSSRLTPSPYDVRRTGAANVQYSTPPSPSPRLVAVSLVARRNSFSPFFPRGKKSKKKFSNFPTDLGFSSSFCSWAWGSDRFTLTREEEEERANCQPLN